MPKPLFTIPNAAYPTPGQGLTLDLNGRLAPGLLTGTLVNADINTAAAIAASKLAAYPGSAAKVLAGDGTWPGGVISAYNTTLLAATGTIDTLAVLPTTFAHMQVWINARGTSAAVAVSLTLRMNNDSTAGHYVDVYGFDTDTAHTPGGDIGAAKTLLPNIGNIAAANAISGWFSPVVIDIPGYASTTGTKAAIGHSYVASGTATGNQYVMTAGGIWTVGGTAINRLAFGLSAGNFDVGSQVTVYVWGA